MKMILLVVVKIFPFLFLISFLNSAASVEHERKCVHKSTGKNHTFSEKFGFGVSTAAYQIEGGWNADGKGPSIWDTFTHNHPELIDDRSNGDEAADSYHRFEQDLAALKELKVQHYRFSISWSRVMPNGDLSSLNENGMNYYNRIINKLIHNGIEPMITMFHYDLPDELMKFGGFANSEIIMYFRYYADTLFERFADRVKLWITFNEPFDYCNPGYGSGIYPPMVHAPGIGDYLCLDNTLRAHATAYGIFKRHYFKRYGGKVGITISSRFFYSKENDKNLVDHGIQFSLGWLANPIFSSNGNYPNDVIDAVKANSKKENRSFPRIKDIKGKWMDRIKGSADFLGLNYYTSRYIENADPPLGENPSWEHDSEYKTSVDPSWKRAKSKWLYCVPQGLEDILKYIRDNYQNVEVMITENGWSDDGTMDDDDRINYLISHLQAVQNAIDDGCNVSRYTHWSLIDNFEWLRGYTEKFGLYAVNMSSPNKERIPKKSALLYKNIIQTRMLPKDFNGKYV